MTENEYLQINQALFSLAHAYESRMLKENPPEKTGMTLNDCAVLMVVGQSEPVQSAELARRMDVTASTTSIYVRRLVDKGLIQMERDSNDRRTWWLALTEQGKFAYQAVITNTVFYTQEFLSALSVEEQQQLHSLLRKAVHALGFDWQ